MWVVDLNSFLIWSIAFCLTLNISINSFMTSFSKSNLLICLTILLCLSHCVLVCPYSSHLWQIVYLLFLSILSLSNDSVISNTIISLSISLFIFLLSKSEFKVSIFLFNIIKLLSYVSLRYLLANHRIVMVSSFCYLTDWRCLGRLAMEFPEEVVSIARIPVVSNKFLQ